MAFFGEKLRQQRELRGISLRDISEATKISVRFLQALETDRIDILPGGIFRRSFVREYARFVGLDPERMVSEFLHAHGDAAERTAATPPTSATPAATAPGTRNGFYRRFFFGVLVIAAAGGAWAWTRRDPAVAAVAAPTAPAIVFQDHLLPERDAAPPSALVLTLKAKDDCWVALHAEGRVLLEKTLRAGESQTVQADDEIVLDVGDAGALDLTVNDRPASSLGGRGEVRRNIVIKKETAPLPPALDAPSARRASAESG
jgi:cytoskeletal protein RodZ